VSRHPRAIKGGGDARNPIPSAMADIPNTVRSVTVVDCAMADFAWVWPVMSIKHTSLTNLAES
jgi:hypothetical protein